MRRLACYEDLLKRFGSDDVVVLSLHSESLFSPEGLATLIRVTSAVERAEGVHHVEGLANAVRFRPVDGDLEISSFLESLPRTQSEADRLRDDALADPLRAGTFVSRDGMGTAIIVTFERMPEDVFLAKSLDLAVLEIARSAAPDMSVVLAGTPITGRAVLAATMPGRCAAPPAPAIITSRPRPAACSAN